MVYRTITILNYTQVTQHQLSNISFLFHQLLLNCGNCAVPTADTGKVASSLCIFITVRYCIQ